ncbi:MAG: DUF6263 family protein, partial [Gemmataceae bacterium]
MMYLHRLLAGFLMVGLLAGLTVPAAVGQEKDKEKPKEKDTAPAAKAPGDKPGDKAPEAKPAEDKGEKVSLKWKFEKDKVFYQKMVTKTVQTMKVMNNDVNQTQNQTFYFAYKPVKMEGDKATIEQKIIGVAMDIEIGGSKISYDSTKDTTASNPLGDFFKARVDSTFTITYDTKLNKVTGVEGRDGFIQKLAAANPQMKPLLEVILIADALKEMAEPTFALVPNKEVGKAEKWARNTKLDMGPIGKYDNEYTYTYEGAEGQGDKQMQKIKVDTVLKYSEPGEVAGQGGLPFKIKKANLKSSSPGGQVLFSSAKGRLEKSNTKIELKGDLNIEIGG